MKIMVTSFNRSPARTAALSAPDPAGSHCGHTPLPETPGQSQESLSQSLLGSLLLSPGPWCIQGSIGALQESVSPVLCKFWWLYGGVNGDLLQEGLCQHPSLLHPEPLTLRQLTADPYSSGDAHTQLWLRLCGVSGSWYTQGLLEPPERLWRV